MGTGLRSTALVTGGSVGIGYAVARKLLESGADVTLLGRRESALREAAGRLGGDVHWIRADVGVREDVEKAVQAIVERVGTIDILINNAGGVESVSALTPLAEAETRWDAVIGANLKGAFLTTVAVVPHLRRPGGRIVNISSIAAYTGGSGAGSLAYAASKAGLNGLTYATARELSGDGITVNAIAPGMIAETEFGGGLSEEKRIRTVPHIPAGRAGQPDDIAAAVAYLVSPAAAYVTGEVLNVNGGWLFGR